MALTKPPPHNLDAETAILGIMINYPDTIPKIFKIIEPTDFYNDSNFNISQSILELQKETNLLTLKNHLESKEIYEKVGGFKYLSDIATSVSTGTGWRHWAEALKKLSKRRNLLYFCQRTVDSCLSNQGTIEEFEKQLRSDLNALHINPKHSRGVDFSNIYDAERMFQEYEQYLKRLKENRFITGIYEIDKRIRGVGGGEVLVIIARAGTYKTALLQNLLRQYIYNSAWASLFFSLEMPIANITERYLQMTTEMRGHDIERSCQEDSEKFKQKFIRSLNRFFVIPNIVSVSDIKLYIQMLEQKLHVKIGVIGIDYLGLMDGDGKGEYEIVSKLAKDIKSLAKSLNIPVILISQTSRKAGTGDKEISLDMSRGSGVIEESADFLLGLFKDDDKIICKILKNRKGRIGSCWEIQLDPKTFLLGGECIRWTPPKSKWKDNKI